MQKISFNRVIRYCGANKYPGARLIYDFNVLIDGEHRATLHKHSGAQYSLYDTDGRAIHIPGEEWLRPHLGSKVKSRANFLEFIQNALAGGRIPTLAEMAALREQEAAARQQKKQQEAELRRQKQVQEVAPELLAACKAQRAALDTLFAMLVELKSDFYPSKSGKPWEALIQGNAAILKAEREEP